MNQLKEWYLTKKGQSKSLFEIEKKFIQEIQLQVTKNMHQLIKMPLEGRIELKLEGIGANEKQQMGNFFLTVCKNVHDRFLALQTDSKTVFK